MSSNYEDKILEILDYKGKIIEVAEHYGAYSQSIQTVEEMAGLAQALTKFWRHKGTDADKINELKEHIFEELADVQIMLDQIAYLFIAEKIVDEEIKRKIDKQLAKIKAEKGR